MKRYSVHNSVFKTTFSALLLSALCAVPAQTNAQDINQEKNTHPLILYSGTPKQYEIGGIRVTGGEGYEDYVLIGLSGLSVGQTITVPGDEVTQAVKRYWRHGLFSQAKIEADSIVGNKIFLNIALVQRPRISDIVYHGVKKSEGEDLESSLGIMIGGHVTPKHHRPRQTAGQTIFRRQRLQERRNRLQPTRRPQQDQSGHHRHLYRQEGKGQDSPDYH